jgi:hypothetical protein
MMKKLITVIAIVALNGCAVTYTLEGKKYESKESFQQAVDLNVAEVLSTIAPLPAPISKKKLIIATPSESTLITEYTGRFVKSQGNPPVGNAKEIIDNLAKSNYKNTKIFFDAVKKKNVYLLAQLIEMQAMTGSYEASSESDALYYVEPTQGAGQWFYQSSKGGKQIFAYDRSAPTATGKVQAFVDAVMTQAIRE